MSLFSFLKEGKQLKCDWCGKEIKTPSYIKYIHNKKFNFCSDSCKRNFRKSGKGRGVYRRCPTCALAPKSWDK
jgi:ribosomal protein L24E